MRLARQTRASRIFWTAIQCVAVVSVAGRSVAQKPSRERIVEFAESCKQQQKQMDLIAKFGTDYSGLDLSGVDFRGYHHLNYETNLRDADFSHCNLEGAQFGACVLDGSDFTGAILDRASFVTASLKNVVLTNAKLSGTRIYQCDLSGAQLAHVDCSSAEITGCDFAGADLSHAILAGAKSDHWWNDFRMADLTGADLTGLKMNGAQFQNAVLRSANLSNTRLVQADFSGADLTDTVFDGANVDAAVFHNTRGLARDEKQALERRAQRWKHDLKTGFSRFRKAAYFPSYFAVVVALIVLSWPMLRSTRKSPRWILAACVNAAAIVPACLLFCMAVLGAHPTVQFNVGSGAAMTAWSAWVSLWPVLMIGLCVCLVAGISLAVVYLISLAWPSARKHIRLRLAYTLLTVVHCLFATHWIGSNFPSA